MATDAGIARVQLHKTTPEEKGRVQAADGSTRNDELDKADFEHATKEVKEYLAGEPAKPSKAEDKPSVRQQTADAVGYVEGKARPDSTEVKTKEDPEINYLRSAVADTAADVKNKVAPSEQDKTTQSSNNEDKSVVDTIKDAASALYNKVVPSAEAMERSRDPHTERAGDAVRHAGHDIEHATHDLGVAARETAESAKESGRYAVDRLGDAKDRSKDYLYDTQRSLRNSAQETKERSREYAYEADRSARQAGWEARDAARDTADRAADAARAAGDYTKTKVEEAGEQTKGFFGSLGEKIFGGGGGRDVREYRDEHEYRGKYAGDAGLSSTSPSLGAAVDDTASSDTVNNRPRRRADAERAGAEAYGRTKGALQGTNDAIREGWQHTKEDVREGWQHTKDDVRGTYESAKRDVRDKYDDAKDTVHRKADEVRREFHESMTPHNQWEAARARGEIPSNTAEVLGTWRGTGYGTHTGVGSAHVGNYNSRAQAHTEYPKIRADDMLRISDLVGSWQAYGEENLGADDAADLREAAEGAGPHARYR
jgi:ElaB/YqjD/DUF883 family membrane-anchored ribosome-binding protein